MSTEQPYLRKQWAMARRLWLAGAMVLAGLAGQAQSGDCTAFAGTLSGFKPTDCLLEGGTYIGGISNGDQVVPEGFASLFVLTKGDGLVIQAVSNGPIFNVTSTGLYRVHRLVYDPSTLDLSGVEFGVTTGFDVNGLLIQGGGSICASLDVVGTSILVDIPDAGTLITENSAPCLVDGSAVLSASNDSPVYAPAGYQVLYVLTSGPSAVIENVSSEPMFTVSEAGLYTIHTLVYDPATLDLSIVEFGVTTGFDVYGLFYQGGGNICGALDGPGVKFTVEECPVECTAFAGTLSGFKPTDCLRDGGTYIGGVSNGDQVVPPGYESIFVLTQGPGLVIQAVAAQPIFNVTATGSYTIHRLVYNPSTLDLSIVEFGVTTGFDVNGLLIQGGGEICASLDVVGTSVLVDDPSAGSLVGDAADACLVDGVATISASVVDAPYVPEGYSLIYVLTQGPGLVIVDAGSEPSFTVSAVGEYTIHTLVYDPNTLDLSIVDFGVTTGFDVNGLLVQGGGEICAALDVAGAKITVTECDAPCEANAGTITTNAFETCLVDGVAVISATPDGNAAVPAGYSTVFVLTQGEGLVIVNAGAAPEFTVNEEGSFTIHTLVYDPNTLDLSIVDLGVTTGFDVNSLLIQGGGTICASLDVTGASVWVSDCGGGNECGANAGTLGVNKYDCLAGKGLTISATPNGNSVVPEGYVTGYVLTAGEGLVIVNVGGSPSFTVSEAGLYTIHTLVYDPLTLDLSGVELGVTSGFDVNSLLIQGGGAICASLDVAGAAFNVQSCDDNGGELAFGQVWPVPAADRLNVEVTNSRSARVELAVFDLQGQRMTPTMVVGKDVELMNLDVASLVPGQYIIRMISGDKVTTHRFTKVN